MLYRLVCELVPVWMMFNARVGKRLAYFRCWSCLGAAVSLWRVIEGSKRAKSVPKKEARYSRDSHGIRYQSSFRTSLLSWIHTVSGFSPHSASLCLMQAYLSDALLLTELDVWVI